MRVLFWGTPEFATPSLRALLGEGFDVVGVVTQPDKPVGRSRSSALAPPVKQVAVAEGLTVMQPEKPRGPEFIAELRQLAPDISVVVAYGHLLPQDVIDLPKRGTLNIHASLLPLLRGAAPIQGAIRERHEQTGVTIMRMIQKLDAGPTLLQIATPIAADETYGELALRLSELGATALIEALALMDLGKARETPQNDSVATFARKIDRDTTRVDWSGDARSVSAAIRAYDPRPGAFSTINGVDVKLFGAKTAHADSQAKPGTVLAADKDGLLVATAGGAVRVLQVQPAGKKRMDADKWTRGRGVSVGDRLA